MWDKQKTDIFNKIKAINPNARASFYENKTIAEMLKILKSYESKNNKFKSLNKSKQKDNINNKVLKNKDYDTDESTESKFKKGLEYYDLEDVDTKSFDISEKQEENLITEGIHLIAHVKDKQSGESITIEDNDYNSKQQFENDLKSNGYVNISILDNRDLYLIDNSDFTKISQVKRKLRELKKDIEYYNEEEYPFLHKQAVDDYNNLKELYDNAMKISLTESYVLREINNGEFSDKAYHDNEEKLNNHKNIDMCVIEESFNFVNKEDEPKFNDYIGLSMQIDGTKTKIKTLKAKIDKDKYDADKNKHKYQLNYYEQLLDKYKEAMNSIENLKENTTIKAKYKPMVKDFYKTPTGTWMIDLNDGYVTSYGTNYIERKTKSDCIYELENFVSREESEDTYLNENKDLKNTILYHGSANTNLTNLDIGKSEGNGDQLGKGIYLTTNYDEAQSYAGSTGKVYKVQLDNNLKLFNLKNKLSDSLKQQLNKELNASDNKDVKNYICMFNRKVYNVQDKQEGLKFYQDKQEEWKQLDNKYFGNIPKAVKNGNDLQVIYTDYNDIQNAINNMTGENLLDTLSGDIDPEVFVTIIIGSGYDGVITHNEKWYVIYKNIDKVTILNESKNLQGQKLEEASRNELLALAKSQTITRYNKSAGYKGFSIVDIDTTMLLKDDTMTVTCNVGKYYDTIQLMDLLIWIQMESERNQNNQVNTKSVTAALMEAIDALEIKVDCTCPDFCLEENTKIKLLNGEVYSIKELKDKFDNNEELWVYSTDINGDFKPGKVKDIWISGYQKEMIKITLDNNAEIITTLNHKFMMRDGSYKAAKNLNEYDSLMPLYFSYHNGYENVKRNSAKTTIFDSVYKQVANNVLQKEIEEAKDRTKEDIIQIHHKDFNKLNNYPSNLYPMGQLEHWHYHSKLGGDHIKKFIEGGRRFWKEDPRRFEALKKQKKAASESKKTWWTNLSEKEKKEWISKNKIGLNKEALKKISEGNKKVWQNYNDKQYKARCVLNHKNNQRGKEKQSIKRKEYWQSLNKEQYNNHKDKCLKNLQKATAAIKGKSFTEDHKQKISNSLKGKTFNKDRLEKMRLAGIKSAQQNKETRCLRNIKELIELNIPITPENFLQNRKQGDAHYLKVFDSFESMLQKFNIPSNYNHKVKSIEIINYENPIPVYDLEVENYHNFYVDAGIILHNCYRFAYQASVLGYKYGRQENRPANITNPNNYGSLCKHQISMLSNKKWLQQVTSTLMDWIVKHIDEVNQYLRVKEGQELTLPNELARQNAKKGFYAKLFKDKLEEPEEEKSNEEDIQNNQANIQDDSKDNNTNNTNNNPNDRNNIDNEEDENESQE